MTKLRNGVVAVVMLCVPIACGGSHELQHDMRLSGQVNDAASAASRSRLIPTPTTLDPVDRGSGGDDVNSPVVPQPEPSPSDPNADVAVVRIGTIRIPAIKLVHPIYEGVWAKVINQGPGHWPGAAMPGELGNAVFAGHRVSHTHPFLNLDRLRVGDAIIFEMKNGTFTYRVRATFVVLPTDIWVVDQRTNSEATLIACHPKGSARQRIVVKADLVT